MAGNYPNPTLATNAAGTTQAAGDNSTLLATDAFVTTAVNNAIAGVNPAVAVQAATTAAGDTSGLTYANGVSGVGATLTGAVNTPITIDGVLLNTLGQRLLVKNDTQSPSGAFNGVYALTVISTVGTAPVFTRALDYDTPSDMNNTGAIPVVNGTANATTSWVLTSSVTTVGTSPLTYTKFTLAPSTIQTGPLTGDVTTSGAVATVVRINGTSLAGLATGILKNTTSTGVPSIAVSGTDYASANVSVVTTSFTTNAYTLALADANTAQQASNGATAATVTVPANATVAFPVGTVITFTQTGTGKIQIAAAGGVTITSSISGGFVSGTTGCRAEFSTIGLLKTATNTWVLSGDAA